VSLSELPDSGQPAQEKAYLRYLPSGEILKESVEFFKDRRKRI
jgi:hypothetical protein